MRLAEAVQLPVPRSTIWKGKKHNAYIVERYDRKKVKGGIIERLHQEDLCQVLGFMPDQKYENEGGPGLAECCQILDMYSSQPILDKQAIIKWVIFNYFIGNADAHGKNLSLIREIDGSIRLAPFYNKSAAGVFLQFEIFSILKENFIIVKTLRRVNTRGKQYGGCSGLWESSLGGRWFLV